MVSVCLPSDALLQHYHLTWVSLTLDMGYLFMATPAKRSHCSLPWTRDVWGGLTNSCEKKRSESKGEKERYTHLNAEFQRIARRDKKAFLSDQYKEIEENNRMGKTRDLFKKIRNTKGTFHAKMSSKRTEIVGT